LIAVVGFLDQCGRFGIMLNVDLCEFDPCAL
jgi:hypothetical protein